MTQHQKSVTKTARLRSCSGVVHVARVHVHVIMSLYLLLMWFVSVLVSLFRL